MPGVMAGLLVLFRFLPALSPRNFEVDAVPSTYLLVMDLVLALLGYMHAVIIHATVHAGTVSVSRLMLGGLFLFFALLGNVLGRVRRNFYIGVRVPWTLASERVWNDTHRLAAWLFVVCGMAGFGIILAGLPLWTALGLLAVAALVPIVYSFIHYKSLERQGAL